MYSIVDINLIWWKLWCESLEVVSGFELNGLMIWLTCDFLRWERTGRTVSVGRGLLIGLTERAVGGQLWRGLHTQTHSHTGTHPHTHTHTGRFAKVNQRLIARILVQLLSCHGETWKQPAFINRNVFAKFWWEDKGDYTTNSAFGLNWCNASISLKLLKMGKLFQVLCPANSSIQISTETSLDPTCATRIKFEYADRKSSSQIKVGFEFTSQTTSSRFQLLQPIGPSSVFNTTIWITNTSCNQHTNLTIQSVWIIDWNSARMIPNGNYSKHPLLHAKTGHFEPPKPPHSAINDSPSSRMVVDAKGALLPIACIQRCNINQTSIAFPSSPVEKHAVPPPFHVETAHFSNHHNNWFSTTGHWSILYINSFFFLPYERRKVWE